MYDTLPPLRAVDHCCGCTAGPGSCCGALHDSLLELAR